MNRSRLFLVLVTLVGVLGDFEVLVASGGTEGAIPPQASQGSPDPFDLSGSAQALRQLRAYLAQPSARRGPIDAEPFVDVALDRQTAEDARAALWQDLAATVRATRAAEHQAKALSQDGYTLRYETVEVGEAKGAHRDLFISMHGGGSGPASSNDEQWRNQIALATGYAPVNALWVAPRAPTNEWNMWFRDEIDPLFDRLITNFVVFEGVDPDRVFLIGYSAGGDGVYGLAPRTADHWAGAASSAGHPNDASFVNLRNVAFAIHVGGDDTAYDRNRVAQQSIDAVTALHAADPEGYPFQGQVHPGLPHWMELADAVAIPFLQAHTRNPVPRRVVWQPDRAPHSSSYWLALQEADLRPGTRIVANLAGQTIDLEQADGVSTLVIRLDDRMIDLDQIVRVTYKGRTLFEDFVPRTLGILATTLAEREDPSLVFSAEIWVELGRLRPTDAGAGAAAAEIGRPGRRC